MKTFNQFLTEKKEHPPLDRYDREKKFPLEEEPPKGERDMVEDPKTQPLYLNKHTSPKSGILYVQMGEPFKNACEWWIKTIPVRAYTNGTAKELTPQELGYGYSSHYAQTLEDLTVFNNCNQYKITRYI